MIMIEVIIAAAVGAGAGAAGLVGYQRTRQINGKNQIERDLADAKTKASDIVLKAKDEALKIENDVARNGKRPKIVWRIARRLWTINWRSLIDEQKNCARMRMKLIILKMKFATSAPDSKRNWKNRWIEEKRCCRQVNADD